MPTYRGAAARRSGRVFARGRTSCQRQMAWEKVEDRGGGYDPRANQAAGGVGVHSIALETGDPEKGALIETNWMLVASYAGTERNGLAGGWLAVCLEGVYSRRSTVLSSSSRLRPRPAAPPPLLPYPSISSPLRRSLQPEMETFCFLYDWPGLIHL